jgi:hypothetical protein
MDVRLHGPDRLSQRISGFLVRKFLDVAQDHGIAIATGKR